MQDRKRQRVGFNQGWDFDRQERKREKNYEYIRGADYDDDLRRSMLNKTGHEDIVGRLGDSDIHDQGMVSPNEAQE